MMRRRKRKKRKRPLLLMRVEGVVVVAAVAHDAQKHPLPGYHLPVGDYACYPGTATRN
jgi:hypothetical protein